MKTGRDRKVHGVSLVTLAAALAIGASGVLVPRRAAAQDVVYQKKTVIEFGDDTIEGDLSRPDGQYLESRKRLRHQRLIKVRESFRAEILKTVRRL